MFQKELLSMYKVYKTSLGVQYSIDLTAEPMHCPTHLVVQAGVIFSFTFFCLSALQFLFSFLFLFSFWNLACCFTDQKKDLWWEHNLGDFLELKIPHNCLKWNLWLTFVLGQTSLHTKREAEQTHLPNIPIHIYGGTRVSPISIGSISHNCQRNNAPGPNG